MLNRFNPCPMNDIASLFEKIQQIATKELTVKVRTDFQGLYVS